MNHRAASFHDPSPVHQWHRRIGRLALIIALIAFLASAAAWGSAALYFGDSMTGTLQKVVAALYAGAGIVAILGVFSRRWRWRAAGGFLVLFAAVTAWWFGIEPSNDRQWQTEVARLPYATFQGDLVTVHDVRNFDYRSETDFTPGYYTKTYDLRKLDRVDLYSIYWMGPAIAHTIISFGFGDQDHLAISIEARKEQGEAYSSIKGFFRQYELIYVVADERDVIRLRTNYRNDPVEDVYLYQMQGSPAIARRFFLAYIEAVNELRERPRFYNTLTANCTNMIWLLAQVNPGRVPFSWKVLASGYAPEYLYDMGRLDTSVPFSELQARGHINQLARLFGNDPDFSLRIRAGSQGETAPAAIE